MKVISIFNLLAQIINFSNSFSLKFFKATTFILTFILFFIASLIPLITLSKFPNLVISLYLFGFIVSREILIRLTPNFFNSFAYFANNVPFEVNVISFKLVLFFLKFSFFINSIISFLTKGSPPVILILLTPSSIKLSQSLSISYRVNISLFGKKVIFSFMQ